MLGGFYTPSMKAVVVQQQGSPVSPNISLQSDWGDPKAPERGSVVIRTICSAFNHMDLWVGRGVPGLHLDYPRVSGCDGCGEVIAVGEGVDESWIGERVIYNAAIVVPDRVAPDDPPASTMCPNYELIGEHHFGAHAEMFSCPAENLAVLSDDADPIEAAAFGLCALTAYSMMITKGDLRPGQSVLITGIGGGVATSALAIAKHLGCRVAVTSRHQWKLDEASKLGADECVLDEGQDWSKQIRGWTKKRGVDMAVDSVGKVAHLSCIKSLARGGAYVTPGCTTGPDATTDLARIFWNQLRILGSTMGSNDEFKEVVALFNTGALRPVIDKVFSPDECVSAYERLEAGEQFGKIVIDWRK
jgi:NADPH:quinone reductase-like Zn-dependent oxidoreductase